MNVCSKDCVITQKDEIAVYLENNYYKYKINNKKTHEEESDSQQEASWCK